MAETVNQATNQNGTGAGTQERTFTQSELNAIVTDRLSREREQYADYAAIKEKAAKYDAAQEADKTDLQKATEKVAALQAQVEAYTKADNLRSIREKVSKETGVPAGLLYGEDEDSCKAQAQAILDYAKPVSGGTAIRDGGEPQAKPSGSTRDQFADWFNKATK
nr:MAG TPA: Major capsid protein [Caudoviricetes sp.]DAJ55333.1 MAG TPA: Major capsid protein [Caudoviricetes sp.]